MAVVADTLPDDPGTLKAMLLAERARAERLEQIIKELQRHRFGRRAEALPEDQLLLGLEEVEQAAASSEAAERRRHSNQAVQAQRQAPQQPWITAGSPAACRDGGRCRGPCLPMLPQCATPDRRGRERAARHRPGAVPGAGRTPSQVRLPGLRGGRGAGSRASAADRGWIADRGDGRPGPGLQICRSSAAVPASPNLCPSGHRSRPLDPGGLGRPCRLAPAACL